MKNARSVLFLILAFATFGLAGCNGSTAQGNQDCPAGELLIEGSCRVLCVSNSDCASGEVCGTSDYCVTAAGPAPLILNINGNGTPDGRAGYSDHRIYSGLVIRGENLLDATVSLDGSGSGLGLIANLYVQPGATANEMTVDLPVDIQVGTYLLEVANAFGADQATVQVLQGEQGNPGNDGVCDAAACVSQTLPGASEITSLFLRGIGAGATLAQSLVVSGAEQITSPATGIWLGVLARSNHAFSADPDHNRNYDLSNVAERQSLVLELQALTAADIVILVSNGDVAAHMNVDIGSGQTLREAILRLGANPALETLPTDHSFVLVGYPTIGAGNAVTVVSGEGHAEAAAIIADDMVLGPRWNDRFKRTMYEANGNIGIGTSNPQAALQINRSGDAVRVVAGAPQMKFADTDETDYWIHINSNRFYILWDEDEDGAWDSPHPMYFEGRDAYFGGNIAVAGTVKGLDLRLSCSTTWNTTTTTSTHYMTCPTGYIATGSGWEPATNWDSSAAHWVENGTDSNRCGFYIGGMATNWRTSCTCCRIE